LRFRPARVCSSFYRDGQQVAALGVVRQTFFRVAFDGHVTPEECGVDLAAEFARCPAFADGHGHVEVAFGG
jgi:hypothetical protein